MSGWPQQQGPLERGSDGERLRTQRVSPSRNAGMRGLLGPGLVGRGLVGRGLVGPGLVGRGGSLGARGVAASPRSALVSLNRSLTLLAASPGSGLLLFQRTRAAGSSGSRGSPERPGLAERRLPWPTSRTRSMTLLGGRGPGLRGLATGALSRGSKAGSRTKA